MTPTEILKDIITKRGLSYQSLSENAPELGTKSNIAQILNGSDMKVSTFLKFLQELECDLVVQDGYSEDDEYIIDMEI